MTDPQLDLEARVKQPSKPPKPLKHARSQAELTALNQRKIQIALTATNVLLSGLTLLKVFGIL